MRITRDREAFIRLLVDDEGGNLVNADDTPVLTVLGQDGVALAGDQAPGDVVPETAESVGQYKAELPGRSELEILDAQWSFAPEGGTFTRTQREPLIVTAQRLAPLTRYREDDELRDISTVNLIRLADMVEDWFTSAMGFPSVETPFRRDWRVSSFAAQSVAIPTVAFPQSLTAWTINDTLLPDEELATMQIVGSQVQRAFGSNQAFLTGAPANRDSWAPGRYVVTGTHGARPAWEGRVPEDLQRAAVILARYASRNGRNYPERASQVAEENTLIYFSVPGPNKPTGLPEVDGVVVRYALNSAV